MNLVPQSEAVAVLGILEEHDCINSAAVVVGIADGGRADYLNDWELPRSSNTMPSLILWLEADTLETYNIYNGYLSIKYCKSSLQCHCHF